MSSWASSLVWNGSVSSQVIFPLQRLKPARHRQKRHTASDCDGCQVIFKHWFQFFVLLMRTHALQDTNTLFFSHHRSATCTRSDLHHLGAQNLPWYRPSVISLSVAHWSCHLNCKCLPEHQVSVSLWTLFINKTLLISLFYSVGIVPKCCWLVGSIFAVWHILLRSLVVYVLSQEGVERSFDVFLICSYEVCGLKKVRIFLLLILLIPNK
jgi:hypothetical protein